MGRPKGRGREYKAEGDDYIPVERWGQDHWSTFAYLECRAVDHKGVIKNANMRTDARLHRHMVTVMFGGISDGSSYPTRLNDGTEIEKHDDWSCLEDMVAAGLLRSWFWIARRNQVFGDCDARVEFTPEGLRIAGMLRAHKATGGPFGSFSLNAVAA